MTQEERRIKILHKRLRLLGEYLEMFSGQDSAPSFAEFANSKGVTREMFIKDLPPELSNVPGSGYDNVLEYAIILHETLGGIHNLSEMEKIAADGNNLEEGMINYNDSYMVFASDGKKDCGCGCNGNCNESNADGNNHDGEEPYLQYIFQEGTEPGLNFAASGGCGLPPVPPPFPNPKKVKNSIQKAARKAWDKYKEKHAAYRRCINAKKESGGYTFAEKAEHVSHMNPLSPFTLGRVAFLKLISNNVFGFAQTYERMRKSPNQDHWNKTKRLFYRLGGDPKKLDANVSIGHSKKPIFRPKGWRPKGATTSNGADGSFSADGIVWYNGEAYTAAGIAAIITAATGVISQMAPIIKSFKKDNGEPDIDLEGTPDPNYTQGDIPEGSPNDGEGEGLSTTQWIGIGAGVAIVLGIVGYLAFKK